MRWQLVPRLHLLIERSVLLGRNAWVVDRRVRLVDREHDREVGMCQREHLEVAVFCDVVVEIGQHVLGALKVSLLAQPYDRAVLHPDTRHDTERTETDRAAANTSL